MQEATSKEKVLKRIRKALINKSKESFANVDFDSPLFAQTEEISEILFAQKFTENVGKFVFCEDTTEALENLSYLASENKWTNILCAEEKLKTLLQAAKIPFKSDVNVAKDNTVAITTCEYLVARHGAIAISSAQQMATVYTAMADVHIVFATTKQIVMEIKDALLDFKTKYAGQTPSTLIFVNGPSRTADIENQLIIGAHGPKEVYLFLIDSVE